MTARPSRLINPLLSTATSVAEATAAAVFPPFVSNHMLEQTYSAPMMTPIEVRGIPSID